MGGAHSQGRARYFAKHIKADSGDKRKRRLIKNGSLRNESARLFPFLIPLFVYFSTFFFIKLSGRLSFRPVIVDCYLWASAFWRWGIKIRYRDLSSPVLWRKTGGLEQSWHFVRLDFLWWPTTRICTWLGAAPYSHCKHVGAKSQGDGLGKVSQGRCRLSVLSHRRTPQHAKLLKR